jgi:hypothetical protein
MQQSISVIAKFLLLQSLFSLVKPQKQNKLDGPEVQ